MLAALRHAARRGAQSARQIHSSSVRAGGHGDDYVHAPQMYNLGGMKNRKLKFGLGVFAVVGLGTAIPFIAVEWSHMKARG